MPADLHNASQIQVEKPAFTGEDRIIVWKKHQNPLSEEPLKSDLSNDHMAFNEVDTDIQSKGITTRKERIDAPGPATGKSAPLGIDAQLLDEGPSQDWSIVPPNSQTMQSDFQVTDSYQASRSPRAASVGPRTVQEIEQLGVKGVGPTKFNPTMWTSDPISSASKSGSVNTSDDPSSRSSPGTEVVNLSQIVCEPPRAIHTGRSSSPMVIAATRKCTPKPHTGSHDTQRHVGSLKIFQGVKRKYIGSDSHSVPQTRSASKRTRLAQI